MFSRDNDMMSRIRTSSFGFTLLDLLVVMVIIGLLVGYVGPMYFKQVGKSEIKAARAQVDSLGKALDQYRLDTGRYPSSEQGLGALNDKPSNENKWDGPYLKKNAPPDPWGTLYFYKRQGGRGEYDIISCGKDGVAGGTGEAARHRQLGVGFLDPTKSGQPLSAPSTRRQDNG